MLEDEVAILIQNSFPTLEKYIDHIHLKNGKSAKVPSNLCSKKLTNFKDLQEMKKKGINLFFTDIDKIRNQMLDELKKDSK